MVEAAAAFAAWAGAAAIVLSDGRRGLAVATAVVAAGLALAVLPEGGVGGMVAIAAGGAVAAARRWSVGPPGWQVMPAGSTPRLVLSIATGIVALWLGVAVMSGPGGALRVSVLAALALVAGRILTSEDAAVTQTAFAVLALGAAAASTLGPQGLGPWPYVAGAVVAAAVAWLPQRTPRAA